MKKLTIFYLIVCTFTNYTFAMFIRPITTKAKKARSLCVDIRWCTNRLQEQRAQLVMQRQEIKDRNSILIKLLIEQNKIIDEINDFNRPMIDLEYFLSQNQITSLAQKMMDLEQQIRA